MVKRLSPWARRWLRFRTDSYLRLNIMDARMGRWTAWMDGPGPSTDDIEMQPEIGARRLTLVVCPCDVDNCEEWCTPECVCKAGQ